MNAAAPLKLPFVAAHRTLRAGFKLGRALAMPALGAAAVGAVVRKARRSGGQDGGERSAPVQRTSTATAGTRPTPGPAPSGSVAVTPDPAQVPIQSFEDPADVVLPSELPIRSYDALPAKDAARAIRELESDDEVRTVLEFEEQNAKRATVLTAARARLNSLESSS